jgi:hypothetical protein
MTEPTHTPPSLPPLPSAPSQQRPGDDPADREPVRNITDLVEAVLRRPRRVIFQLTQAESARLIAPLLAVALALIAVYGLIVGSFSGGLQWWAAPAKIAGGTLATAAICLPSLYIFACLGGSPARFATVTGALGGLLALMTLLLIGFAPVAWLFSQSTNSVVLIGWLHLLFWAVAAGFGIRFLLAAFSHFGLRSTAGLKVWIVIFLLVSLQMTSALRPLVGTADTLLPTEKRFFVTHWLLCFDSSGR